MGEQPKDFDIAVVGGGLAGLASAALAARAGKKVVVIEKGRAVGGRAATQTKSGFFLNQGPHALYRGSAAMRALRTLDIEITGGVPSVAGSFAWFGGRLHTLLGGFVSLLTTSLLPLAGKLELGRFFTRLPRVDARPFDRTSVETWLPRHFIATPSVDSFGPSYASRRMRRTRGGCRPARRFARCKTRSARASSISTAVGRRWSMRSPQRCVPQDRWFGPEPGSSRSWPARAVTTCALPTAPKSVPRL
jgi:hypothetical protein